MDKVQAVAKNVIPVTVVGNPGQVPGLQIPVGTKPTGALVDGQVYLFSDNIVSVGDAYVTLFHELFHLGLHSVIPAEDYAALLRQFADSAQVQSYIRRWKNSPEGRERAAAMPSAAYDALATEEALAMVSEDLSVSGIGTNRSPALVKKMLGWLANVADKMGLPGNFGSWIRGLTQTDAERFVSDMTRAALGGEKNLAQTQRKYGTMARQMTTQDRLREGSEESRLASIFEGLQGNAQAKMRAQRALRTDPRAEAIRDVEANFMDILARLDDAKLVKINC